MPRSIFRAFAHLIDRDATSISFVMDHKSTIAQDRKLIRDAARLSLCFVAAIWLVWLLENLVGVKFSSLGIFPRDLSGLIGIPLAPFLHDSLRHIVSNTAPAFILGTALLYAYPKAARIALPVFFIGSGIGVWIIGRASIHIGASGVVHGMMFFLFVIGIIRRDRLAIAVALAVLFLYGGMVWGIVPGRPDVSWEAHLCGAILGVLMAYILNGVDPPRNKKRYDWEDESDGDDAEVYVMDRY